MVLLVSAGMLFIFSSSWDKSLMAVISELVWIFRVLRIEFLAASHLP